MIYMAKPQELIIARGETGAGRRWERARGNKRWHKEMTLGGECTMQCAGDMLSSCTLETCMVLLINDTQINSVKK